MTLPHWLMALFVMLADNTMRPHQSLGNVPLYERDGQIVKGDVAGSIGPVRRTKMLGGLLNHYERKAA